MSSTRIYHLDHVGGNGVFADGGATVVAERHVRDWIHTENLRLIGPQIVFGGDLLFHNMLPTLIDASIPALIDTLDLLLARNADYTFVPGHGEVGQTQDVAAFREYLVMLRRLVSKAVARGQSGDAVTAGVMPALKQRYGQMEFFDGVAKQNVIETYDELTGKKRFPPTH
jgi:glyoxylase-like metal-dependent hydrolase (beta-lactamase superfamily II)